VRIAQADVLMRGLERGESFERAVDARDIGEGALESGRRSVSPHGGREGSWQNAGSDQALELLGESDGASQVRCSSCFGGRERPPE